MEIEREEDDNNKKNAEPKKKEIKKEVVQREKKRYVKTKCMTRGRAQKTKKEAAKPATSSKSLKRQNTKKTNEEAESSQEREEEEEEGSETKEEEKKRTKKRKIEIKEKEDDTEEEHEDEEEKESKVVKAKKEKPKKEKQRKATKKVIYPTCITRSSPKAMFDAMAGLTEIRKKCLRDIGFERYINFPITELPSALIYHVVDKFHPPSMELRLEKGSIKVTRQKINDMLGVPMGANKLEELEERDHDDPFIKQWEKQYSQVKKITPAAISTEISSTFNADFIFTINFLTLFASTMGKVDNGAKVFKTVLKHVKESDEISDIDWCGYIMDCLETSKQNWEKVKIGDYFYGPATFLCVSCSTCFYTFIKCDSILYKYYNLTQIYFLYEKAVVLGLNKLPSISSYASSSSTEKLEHSGDEEEDRDGNEGRMPGEA